MPSAYATHLGRRRATCSIPPCEFEHVVGRKGGRPNRMYAKRLRRPSGTPPRYMLNSPPVKKKMWAIEVCPRHPGTEGSELRPDPKALTPRLAGPRPLPRSALPLTQCCPESARVAHSPFGDSRPSGSESASVCQSRPPLRHTHTGDGGAPLLSSSSSSSSSSLAHLPPPYDAPAHACESDKSATHWQRDTYIHGQIAHNRFPVALLPLCPVPSPRVS